MESSSDDLYTPYESTAYSNLSTIPMDKLNSMSQSIH